MYLICVRKFHDTGTIDKTGGEGSGSRIYILTLSLLGIGNDNPFTIVAVQSHSGFLHTYLVLFLLLRYKGT